MAPRKSPKRKSPARIRVSKEGALSKYGYDSKKNAESRHRALRKAARASSPVDVVRRLNAVAVLNKNKNPRLAAKFRADMNWVQKNLYSADKRKAAMARKSPSKKRGSPKRASPKKSKKRGSPIRASPKRASPKRNTGRKVTGVTQSLLRAGWRETKSAASRRAALKKLAKSRGVNFVYNQLNHAMDKSNVAAVRKAARADEGWVYSNARTLEKGKKRASPKKSPKRASPKKSPKRASPKKGNPRIKNVPKVLTDAGWKPNMSASARRKILTKLIREHGAQTVHTKLNYVYTHSNDRNDVNSAHADTLWLVQTQY